MNMQLRLKAVTISIDQRLLIPSLDLEVAPGEIVTLMGPSGCGKSALLSFIGGTLDSPFQASGRVYSGAHDITDIPPDRRRVGVLFQDDLLFPHLSVGGNLAFGLPSNIRGRRERLRRVEAALDGAGLGGFQDRDPSTLSGGQRARVALLRTLLSEPCALLLDEPFGKLDAARREDFRQFVFGHAAARQLPVLMVTHDMADALATGGRTLTIETDPPIIRSTDAPNVSGIYKPTENDPIPIATRLPQIHKS